MCNIRGEVQTMCLCITVFTIPELYSLLTTTTTTTKSFLYSTSPQSTLPYCKAQMKWKTDPQGCICWFHENYVFLLLFFLHQLFFYRTHYKHNARDGLCTCKQLTCFLSSCSPPLCPLQLKERTIKFREKIFRMFVCGTVQMNK